MRPPLSAASALRPHSSASIDRHKLPSLHSYNTSLPALYLPSQGQGQGPSETYSQRDVGFLKLSLHISVHETPETLPGPAYLLSFFWLQGLGDFPNGIIINSKWCCVHAVLVIDLPVVCICSPLWSSHALLTPTLFPHHTSNWASLISQTVKLCQMGCTHPPHKVHR